MEPMFWDGWSGVLRTLVLGVLSYAVLIAFLRLSGKRTLSKMNAFDLVVTVALGSSLATILLNKNVSLTEGLLGLAVLIGLQYAVAWLSSRSHAFSRVVKSEPALLMYRGRYLSRALRRERVTEEEVRSAVRSEGIGGLEEVEAVVLETDGTFSVISRGTEGGASSLQDIRGLEDDPAGPGKP